MKVSLVLPLYNSENYAEECLNSVFAQSLKDYELIVIDDCSKDRTRELLKKMSVKFYCNSVNLGFCKTVNKGIRLAKGEYVAILDHDMVYEKDYLKKMLMESGDIVGARVYYYKNKNKIRALDIKISPLTGKTNILGRDEIDKGQYDSLREIEAIGAGSLVIRKEVFKKAGFFNENLIMYFIDVDFCIRAREKGYKIILSKAKCFHKKQEKEIMTREQKKRYFHDKAIIMKRYPFAFLINYIQIFLNKIKRK